MIKKTFRIGKEFFTLFELSLYMVLPKIVSAVLYCGLNRFACRRKVDPQRKERTVRIRTVLSAETIKKG